MSTPGSGGEAMLETNVAQRISSLPRFRREGRVSQANGLTIEAQGLDLQIGDICHIFPTLSDTGRITAEVVGFHEDRLVMIPLADMRGVRLGSRVVARGAAFSVPVGKQLLGRVIDGLGRPIDGLGPMLCSDTASMAGSAPSPMSRARITTQMPTGVRAIDATAACCRGQRLGIFAGSGVGKSTLLGMISRNCDADVRVIGLIGERGREVQEFIEGDLGPDGLEKSVVVVSTSDQPAMLRLKAAWTATMIAEYFRDQGLNVVLLMDSVTRVAMAQRELGLAAGEPPTTRGYTPSVFSLLPRLLERSGNAERGSISAFYTVLVEGDDLNEPITDAVRGTLDGHIYLSRQLADRGHFPAMEVLGSVSRLMNDVVSDRHRRLASDLRGVMATYENARDLIDIGAYVTGSNPEIDRAMRLMPRIREFLRQPPDDPTPQDRTLDWLESILTSA